MSESKQLDLSTLAESRAEATLADDAQRQERPGPEPESDGDGPPPGHDITAAEAAQAAHPQVKLGELTQLSFDAYRAIDGINASGLKLLQRSPMHYFYDRWVAQRRETPALRMGSMLHAAILEPDRFAARMVRRPAWDLRTKAGKAEREAWQKDLPPDAIEVGEADQAMLEGILTAVRGHNRLRRLLAEGRRECSLVWRDSVHDVVCKARYDFVAAKTNVIVDLKTTASAAYEDFARDLSRYAYTLAAAHYLAGARETGVADPKRFVWAVVEKDPPHAIALYTMSPEEHARGIRLRSQTMTRYAECLKAATWPGYHDGFEEISAPSWAPQGQGGWCPEEWY